jgi:tetratricopeptide (TPR) repeat protein
MSMTADAYLQRAEEHRQNTRYDEAAADYTEAICLTPHSFEAYNGRGILFYLKQEYGQAITDLSEAIRLNPHDADAYNYRGLCHYYMGEYDYAIADFNRALRLDLRHPYAANNRRRAVAEKADEERL